MVPHSIQAFLVFYIALFPALIGHSSFGAQHGCRDQFGVRQDRSCLKRCNTGRSGPIRRRTSNWTLLTQKGQFFGQFLGLSCRCTGRSSLLLSVVSPGRRLPRPRQAALAPRGLRPVSWKMVEIQYLIKWSVWTGGQVSMRKDRTGKVREASYWYV